MAMMWEQSELFPEANKAEIQRTKFLLGKYRKMEMLIEDFEEHEKALQQVAIDGEVARRIDADDLHADKPANVVILMEKQRWVYEQYRIRTTSISRAAGLIRDNEVKQVIYSRYILGYTFKETVLGNGGPTRESTIRRQLSEGVVSVANTLKLIGYFEMDNVTF